MFAEKECTSHSIAVCVLLQFQTILVNVFGVSASSVYLPVNMAFPSLSYVPGTERPRTPGERPRTPGERPRTPGERLGTPSGRTRTPLRLGTPSRQHRAPQFVRRRHILRW